MTTIFLMFICGVITTLAGIAFYGLGRIHGRNRYIREIDSRTNNVYDFATGKKTR